MGRAGAAYRTNVQLELREAHAAARDAVRAEMDLLSVFGEAFVRKWELFEVSKRAPPERTISFCGPDLGRTLNESSRLKISRNVAPTAAIFKIVIGDGLSVPRRV